MKFNISKTQASLQKLTVTMRGQAARYKLPGPGGPERDPGLNYIAYVFVFLGSIIICRMYKLTLSE